MKYTPNARRNFLKQSTLAGVSLPFLSLSTIQRMFDTKSPYLDTIGLQLWSVRNQLEKDPKGTLKALAEMGYQQIELMDTRQISSLKPIADDLGLAVNSSFMLWTTITGNWDLVPHETDRTYSFDKILEEAQQAGLSHLVFGYITKGGRDSIDKYKLYCDRLNEAGEKAQQAGIQLCYHNHSFEFEPMEGMIPFEVLIERLDPELVKFELDVFWASIGGFDPVVLTERIADRIGLLHLKDKLAGTPVIFDEGKVPEDAFKELGNGVVDIPAIIKIGEKAGVKYCFVEQDQSPDPLNSVQQSVAYLKKTRP